MGQTRMQLRASTGLLHSSAAVGSAAQGPWILLRTFTNHFCGPMDLLGAHAYRMHLYISTGMTLYFRFDDFELAYRQSTRMQPRPVSKKKVYPDKSL